MLLYLDANIVQYCADYEGVVFRNEAAPIRSNPKFLKELEALRTLVELEQLGNEWVFAAPRHLIRELLSGKPTREQKDVYEVLLQAWHESVWYEALDENEKKIISVEQSLRGLNFKDDADRRHLAEAITLQTSWLLTNDKNLINEAEEGKSRRLIPKWIQIGRPSECVRNISTGLFLR
jgi:hypothetical protein